jgi:hypothetical protein
VTAELLIRQATLEDLAEVYEVQYEATYDDQPLPPPGTDVLSKFRHEVAEARSLVAVQDGRILGFGAVFERADIAFLATLHVRPAAQAAGLRVGRLLLEQLFPRGAWRRAVVSSRLPRAVALYTRYGMPPQWPLYMLELEVLRLRALPDSDIELVAAESGDPRLLAMDAVVAGRGERPADHAYWERERAAEPFWLMRRGARVGYGYAQHLYRSSDAPWAPEHLMLGPVGVLDPVDAVDAVVAAVRWAAPQGPRLAMDVAGPHPALKTLFEAGFVIVYNATVGFDGAQPVYDPLRYIVADTITL